MADELLKRIDAHMARGAEQTERIKEMRLIRAEHQRSLQVHERLREFIHEQALRMEKAAALQARGL